MKKIIIISILAGIGLVMCIFVFIISGFNMAILPLLLKAIAIEILFVLIVFGIHLFSVPSKSLIDQVKEYKKEVDALDKYVERLKED